MLSFLMYGYGKLDLKFVYDRAFKVKTQISPMLPIHMHLPGLEPAGFTL